MRRHEVLCADGARAVLLLQRGFSMESTQSRRGTPSTRRWATTYLLHIMTSCGARCTRVREPPGISTEGIFVRIPTCHHALLCRRQKLRVADAPFSSAWRLPAVSDITVGLVFLPPCHRSCARLCGSCLLGKQLGFAPCLLRLSVSFCSFLAVSVTAVVLYILCFDFLDAGPVPRCWCGCLVVWVPLFALFASCQWPGLSQR